MGSPIAHVIWNPNYSYPSSTFELARTIEKINGRIYPVCGDLGISTDHIKPIVRQIRKYSKDVEVWLFHALPEQTLHPLSDPYLRREITGVQLGWCYNGPHDYFGALQKKLRPRILENLDENQKFEEAFGIITSPRYTHFKEHHLREISDDGITSALSCYKNDSRFRYFWLFSGREDEAIPEHLVRKSMSIIGPDRLVIGGDVNSVNDVKRLLDLGVENIKTSNVIQDNPREAKTMFEFMLETSLCKPIPITV